MSTVGYGDVNPRNTKERIFVIVLMLLGVLAFSVLTGSIFSIMNSYDERVQRTLEGNMRLKQIFENFSFTNKMKYDLRQALNFTQK